LVVNALAEHVEIRGDSGGRTVTARLFHDGGHATLPAKDGREATSEMDPRPLSETGGGCRQPAVASAIREGHYPASRTALLRVWAGAA
jgi:hypothetical protein